MEQEGKMKFNNKIKSVWILGITLLLSLQTGFSQTQYYIDSINGNDANDGSINTPFNSVTKLNSMTLTAGTKVFLRSGCSWSGQQLAFKGSGTNGNPIVIDKYDTGAAPLLAGNGLTGQAVVYLYNQQFIEINNLEITNSPHGPVNSDFFVGLYQNGTNPLGADRRGVMVALSNFGTANHIYLKNLNIHHIKGQLGSGSTALNGAIPKRTGGIYFDVLNTTEKSSSKSRFNDILIDSCTISYCENIGLAFDNDWNTYYPAGSDYNNWFARRYTNVKVSHNVLHHIGKNAMIIRCTDSTGLIEHNICYETAVGTTGNTMFSSKARGTVFQYNEGYYNRANTQLVDPGNIDGSMYDPDLGSINVIFQYSYSHDNCQGLYWGCNSRNLPGTTAPNLPDPADTGCTARYNISQNDLGDLVYFNYPSAGNHIYNNVFYIKNGLSPQFIHENSRNNHTYDFQNNIIFNLSKTNGGGKYALIDTGVSTQTRTIDYNTFYGNHPASEPADANKLTSNPLFISPGTATTGITTVDGYKLKSTSPCINAGIVIKNAPSADFWGNPVPGSPGLPPCIGAFEYSATLPVKFVGFKAENVDGSNQLIWTTTEEINNAGFMVQHSADGDVFTDEQYIPSKIISGNYAGVINYSFTDVSPFTGTNYYRLKAFDKQGKTTYSTVVVLTNKKGLVPSISVYPNPIYKGNHLSLEIKNLPQGNYEAVVLDMKGNKIASETIAYNGVDGTIQLNTSTTLSKGGYLVQMTNGSFKVLTKVIVK